MTASILPNEVAENELVVVGMCEPWRWWFIGPPADKEIFQR
jgi:hypothetical protein